jgi:biopolymer transport protein ExbD
MPNDRSMTSMIDIVFLLLIFFVCASIGQMRELMLAAELPPDGAINAEEYERQPRPLGDVTLFLRNDAEGRTETVLNEGGDVFRQGESERLKDSHDYRELVARLESLAKGAPEIPVLLDIQPDVKMGDILTVYNACKQAGFHSVNFATDPRHALGESPEN